MEPFKEREKTRGRWRATWRNVRHSKGSMQLCLYTFVGLSSVEFSWPRTIAALAASVVLLFWISHRLAFDENVHESWQWSPAASRGIVAFTIIAAGAMLPFLPIAQSTLGGEQARRLTVSLVAALIFATMIGLAVYLRYLLQGSTGLKDRTRRIESLKLEHQACMMLFQTLTTMVGVFFLGTVLSAALNLVERLGRPAFSSLLWAFYCFSGAIIWLIRPCVARAKYIRFLIEQPTDERNDGTPTESV